MIHRFPRAVAVGVVVLSFCYLSHCPASAQSLADSLRGEWYFSMQTPDLGFVQSRITFTGDAGDIEAHSYDGGAAVVASWFERTLAGITSSMFRKGALLHLTDVTPRPPSGQGMPFAAVFSSAAGAVLLEARVHADTIQGAFMRGNKAVGWVAGSRKPGSITLVDYAALAKRVLDTLRMRFYDPTFVHTDAYEEFAEDLASLGAEAREDADMVMTYYRLAGALPFTHCYLYRMPPPDAARSAREEVAVPLAVLDTTHPGVGIVRIASFAGNGHDVDSVMKIVQRHKPQKLVIDLRGNGGGNVSAVRLARHLVARRTVVGTFVTRQWVGSRTEPFLAADALRLPELETDNVDTLFAYLRRTPGVRLAVSPGEHPYGGMVVVLTDRRTASTCEPLVYGLQQQGVATVIGERTAGAMLSAETYPLGDGWMMVVPTADYYTADGLRLDRRGVIPDIEIPSAQALEQALRYVPATPGK